MVQLPAPTWRVVTICTQLQGTWRLLSWPLQVPVVHTMYICRRRETSIHIKSNLKNLKSNVRQRRDDLSPVRYKEAQSTGHTWYLTEALSPLSASSENQVCSSFRERESRKWLTATLWTWLLSQHVLLRWCNRARLVLVPAHRREVLGLKITRVTDKEGERLGWLE